MNPEKRKLLSENSVFYTMAVTAFSEQLPDGEDALLDALKSLNPAKYQAIAIKHDKSATNKAHYHIAIRLTNSKDRKKVSSMLKQLHIQFRPGIDDALLGKGALETCGEYPVYVNYLLHQTTDAIRANKARYDVSDLVTNLSSDELGQVLADYNPRNKELTDKDLKLLCNRAMEAGKNLESLDALVSDFRIKNLSDTQENRIKKAYKAGVESRMLTDTHVNRLNIIIYTEALSSNSYQRALNATLSALSEKKNCISKKDILLNLEPDTDAIIIHTMNALSAFNNKIDLITSTEIIELEKPLCRKKTLWAGKYTVYITHPSITLCKDKKKSFPSCFLCHISNNELILDRPPVMLLDEHDKEDLISEYKQFRDKFNASLLNQTQYSTITLDDINK